MDGMKTAVMAICAVSAVKCVIGSIAEASKMKNQIAVLMDLMLAVVMISPVVSGIKNFSLPEINTMDLAEYGYSDELYTRALAEQTAHNVESVLMEQLGAAGIVCSKIDAEVNISDDLSISITKVTVTSEDFAAAAEVIRSSLGEETEVEENVE